MTGRAGGVEIFTGWPAERVGDAEVLQEGHDVGEGLVEGRRVRSGGIHEVRPDAVEQGVGGLVRHDVVREARVDDLAGEVLARIVPGGAEIAEQQPSEPPVVVGVRLLHGVRVHAQAIAERRGPPARPRPHHGPAQAELEALDDTRHRRVAHLLVKARIDVARFQPPRHEDPGVVHVHRPVVPVVRDVVVDHRDLAADRSGREVLERDGHDEVVAKGPSPGRVEGEDLHRAPLERGPGQRDTRIGEHGTPPPARSGGGVGFSDHVFGSAVLVKDERRRAHCTKSGGLDCLNSRLLAFSVPLHEGTIEPSCVGIAEIEYRQLFLDGARDQRRRTQLLRHVRRERPRPRIRRLPVRPDVVHHGVVEPEDRVLG